MPQERKTLSAPVGAFLNAITSYLSEADIKTMTFLASTTGTIDAPPEAPNYATELQRLQMDRQILSPSAEPLLGGRLETHIPFRKL